MDNHTLSLEVYLECTRRDGPFKSGAALTRVSFSQKITPARSNVCGSISGSARGILHERGTHAFDPVLIHIAFVHLPIYYPIRAQPCPPRDYPSQGSCNVPVSWLPLLEPLSRVDGILSIVSEEKPKWLVSVSLVQRRIFYLPLCSSAPSQSGRCPQVDGWKFKETIVRRDLHPCCIPSSVPTGHPWQLQSRFPLFPHPVSSGRSALDKSRESVPGPAVGPANNDPTRHLPPTVDPDKFVLRAGVRPGEPYSQRKALSNSAMCCPPLHTRYWWRVDVEYA